MMLSLEEINNFIQQVNIVFGALPYVGDDYIVSSDTIPSNSDEAIEVLKYFKGKRWQDISLDALIANRDNLPVFTPRAYQYYLPAYMIAVISQFENVDVLSSNTLYSLTPPKQGYSWENKYLDAARKFTPNQKIIILKFLELYSRLSPDALIYDPNQHIQKAIEFWEKSVT